MNVVDALTLVLGLGMFGVGAYQAATGRLVTSRHPQPTSQIRAGGAMLSFLGLSVALNANLPVLGHTTHGLIALIFAIGALASGTWLLVLWAGGRP